MLNLPAQLCEWNNKIPNTHPSGTPVLRLMDALFNLSRDFLLRATVEKKSHHTERFSFALTRKCLVSCSLKNIFFRD